MVGELSIRPGTEADTERILELVRVSLGEGTIPRERAYWDWKHHLNPFGHSPMLLAEADGRLVGLRVFMRWEWRSAGRTMPAMRAVDTATHPDWQGQGIFSKLTKELVRRVEAEGACFIFNTPNDRSRPGYLKMGWSSVGRTDIWLRPLRPFHILRKVGRRGGDLIERPLTAVRFPTAAAVLAGDEVRTFVDGLAQPVDTDRLYTPRSVRYLLWRYAGIPGFQYYAVGEVDAGEGAILFFRYKDRGPLRELRIGDFLIGPSPRSRRVARALLARLRRESGADYVSAMVDARSNTARVLARSGFLPGFRLGPILTVRPLAQLPAGAPDIRNRAAWNPSVGDLEIF